MLIQDRRPAVLHLDEQLIDGFCVVEAADGLFREAGLALDRLDALALGLQRLDQVVPLPGADRQRGFFRAAGGSLDRGLLQVRGLRRLGGGGLFRFSGRGFFQALQQPRYRPLFRGALDLSLALTAANKHDEAAGVALEAIKSGRLAPVDGRRACEIVLAVADRGLPEARELSEAYRGTCNGNQPPELAWRPPRV